MSRWTIDEPTTLGFDGVVALRATLIAGSVSVLASGDRPGIQVEALDGPPLVIGHEAGMLTITHERLWEGVLSWLRTQKCHATITVTVPHDCPVSLNLVSADAVVSGTTARTSVKSASGNVVLDGVHGDIDANTVSGDVEVQGPARRITFTSVSGDLTLAGGTVDRLAARSARGRIAADVGLAREGRIEVNTVAGEVALRIPDPADAEVALNSAAGGRLETSFPGLDRRDRSVSRAVTGRLGAGTGRVSVNTVSGAVALLGRPRDDSPEITTPGMEK
ncbi:MULTISPECIES: DUF4097 family beta strand repeat-containing protein [Thermomonosporaceae]|uniref:DUF4097 family beta strand repeat-containing protein n=1 Tax=Thermomonosporaceae TaxID=2012 RepID=UPI00255AD61F|nr:MULTISPECIES: DUF4097 family beta strand repeat-containing protein [Thermomonosporaceae]MDL4771920.1 DUF4097 family beta strand repeat-containing protein [Actinomadura xylanilytica]